jgi:hypothetical protein
MLKYLITSDDGPDHLQRVFSPTVDLILARVS